MSGRREIGVPHRVVILPAVAHLADDKQVLAAVAARRPRRRLERHLEGAEAESTVVRTMRDSRNSEGGQFQE